MRSGMTTAIVTVLLLAGCAMPSRNLVEGVYTSPNGGFSYTVPEPVLLEGMRENILPNGGNVQFFQWSHFKRVDYVSLNPTVEREIQDRGIREEMLLGFSVGTFVPGIVQYVPRAEVRKADLEEVHDVPVLYVTMFMPGASTEILNGKRLDACRCFLAHTDGKRMYVFTVSAGIDPRGELTPEKAFSRTEEWLKPELLRFFDQVSIR